MRSATVERRWELASRLAIDLQFEEAYLVGSQANLRGSQVEYDQRPGDMHTCRARHANIGDDR